MERSYSRICAACVESKAECVALSLRILRMRASLALRRAITAMTFFCTVTSSCEAFCIADSALAVSPSTRSPRTLDRSRAISDTRRALVAASPISWLCSLNCRWRSARRLSLSTMSESFARDERASARPVSGPSAVDLGD